MSNFNPDNYVYFAYLRPNSHYSTNGYENKDGDIIQVFDKVRYLKGGEKILIPKRFSFNKRSNRQLRIPLNAKDMHGNSIVEFLRNHPECEGSPNSKVNDQGQRLYAPWFKEVNSNRDAEIVLKQAKIKREAENLALGLDGDEFIEVCHSFGLSTSKETIARHRLLEYAAADPTSFIENVNATERKPKAIFNEGVRIGTIKKRGYMYKWGDFDLGSTEKAVIERLLEDKKLFDQLSKAVNKEK